MLLPNPQPPVYPTKSIGQKLQLVPHHVTKITYRQGEGPHPKIGQYITCYYNCFLMSGKEILKKRNTTKRLPFGLGRLIEGLQIVLKTTRRNEKFTVIISPTYAYRQIQVKDLPVRQEKLIFEFDIVSIDYISIEQKSQVEVINEAKEQLEMIKTEMRLENYENAIKKLNQKCQSFKFTKYYRNDLQVLFYFKLAQILLFLDRTQQAQIAINQIIQIESTNVKALLLQEKILIKLGRPTKSKWGGFYSDSKNTSYSKKKNKVRRHNNDQDMDHEQKQSIGWVFGVTKPQSSKSKN